MGVDIKAQTYSMCTPEFCGCRHPARAQIPLSRGSAQQGARVSSPPASIVGHQGMQSQLGLGFPCQLQLTQHLCCVNEQTCMSLPTQIHGSLLVRNACKLVLRSPNLYGAGPPPVLWHTRATSADSYHS